MFIEAENIIVRDLKKGDEKNLYRITREADVRRYMPNYSDGYATPEDYLNDPDFFRKHGDDVADIRAGRYCAVSLSVSDEMIGVIAYGLKETLNEIEIGYFISDRHRGKGYAEQAINALTEWIFDISDIPYLIATVLCGNLPSNNLLKKCKFELTEKRIPTDCGEFSEDKSYFYYRRYRA